MCNEQDGDTYFIITHREEEMLKQLRELSDEDRKDVERKIFEIAVNYAEWGK